MIGKTGTCYYRANHCWKGMLILELARGGWVNVYHGNLELLSDEDAKWFARTQLMYHQLQKQDNTTPFGEIPGKGKPYGFKSSTTAGAVCTVVNPSQQIANVQLPVEMTGSKILYADGGYQPKVTGQDLVLGPEQLVVVGFGAFANDKYRLGIDPTINIPVAIDKIQTTFSPSGKNAIECSIKTTAHKNLRIIFQQFDSNGLPYRSWPGAPPDGKKVSEVIKINVSQEGKDIPLHIEYDKMIWSGLSWGAAEIKNGTFDPSKGLTVKCSTEEKNDLKLVADVYEVEYSK
jgi:hypothetical protein